MKLLHSLKKTKELANLFDFSFKVLKEYAEISHIKSLQGYTHIDNIRKEAEIIMNNVTTELNKYNFLVGTQCIIPKETFPAFSWYPILHKDMVVTITAVKGFLSAGGIWVEVQNEQGMSKSCSLQTLKDINNG